MTKPNSKAIDEVTKYIGAVVPGASLQWVDDEQIRVTVGGVSAVLNVGRADLDDLEAILEGGQPVPYASGFRNRLRIRLSIAIGAAGLSHNVRMSSMMLLDKRDWLHQCQLMRTDYRGEMAKNLYDGLKVIENSLVRTLGAGLKLPEVESELEVVRTLTGYYEKTTNLCSSQVNAETLSYLKAGAVCAVMGLERKKDAAVVPRLRQAYDLKIVEIVQIFESTPYDRIKLPTALYDLVAEQRRGGGTSSDISAEIDRAAPANDEELDQLLAGLNPRLRERRIGAWATFRSTNPDRLSQAANSMVELLDQVISEKCAGKKLQEFLEGKYPPHQKTGWVERTKEWISGTKSSLHATKHETNPQSVQLTEALMRNAESIMLIILK